MKHIKLFESWTQDDEINLEFARLGIINNEYLNALIEYQEEGSVGGLWLNGYPLTALPPFIKKVEKDLHLSDSKIESLPEGLEIGGDLYLNDSKNLKALPDNLKIGRDLMLNGTNIDAIPFGLKINRRILLYDTPLSRTGKSSSDILTEIFEKGGSVNAVYL